MKKGFPKVSFLTRKILENQRFVLNIGTAKRTEKYCGIKIEFFEILRKKEQTELKNKAELNSCE